MKLVTIVRHALSTWNAEGRWQGWADPPLSDDGQRQAVLAAEVISKWPEEFRPSFVFASDLIRAKQTAEAIVRHLEIAKPVSIDPDLREYDVGDWCGLTAVEIETRWPGMINEWGKGTLEGLPNGELRKHLDERVAGAIGRVVADTNEGESALVVTHGGVVRSVIRGLGAPDRRVPQLHGIRIRVEAGRSQLDSPVNLLDQ